MSDVIHTQLVPHQFEHTSCPLSANCGRGKARLIDQLDQLGAKRTYDFGFTQGWMCQSVRIREKSIHGVERAPLTGVRRDFL